MIVDSEEDLERLVSEVIPRHEEVEPGVLSLDVPHLHPGVLDLEVVRQLKTGLRITKYFTDKIKSGTNLLRLPGKFGDGRVSRG